jgi:hypothetical protein
MVHRGGERFGSGAQRRSKVDLKPSAGIAIKDRA